MKKAILFAAVCLATSTSAIELPKIPADSIAVKKELLFADDFEGKTPAPLWHKVVPTFAVENGVLKGMQTRDKNVLDDKGNIKIKAHAAVHGLMLPTKSKLEFGVAGKDGYFDDLKIWNAEPAAGK
jgi:hypothetical protein